MEAEEWQDSQTVNGEEEPDLPTWRKILIIVLTTLGFITCNLSSLAVNIALPTIQRELDVTTGDLQWVAAAYTLAYSSTLLFFGRLSDLYGHKRVLLCGMIWLAAWSLACALAPNAKSLFVFRAFMGVGSATVSPSMLGIMGRTFQTGSAWKTLAFAAFSAGAPLGGAGGLVIGGLVTQLAAITWRAFFYFATALTVVLAIVDALVLPKDPELALGTGSYRKVDWGGAGLIVSGLTLVTFAMADGSAAPRGWSTPYVGALLGVGVVLVIVFICLFRRGRFAAVQVVTAFLWASFIDLNYFLTLYYQVYLLLSPIETLLRLLPMTIVGVILNVTFGLLANRVAGNLLMIVGCALTAVSCLLCAVMDTRASYWFYNFWTAVLTVFGADFVFATGAMYGSKVALPTEQGVAGGVFITIAQFGAVFGLTICTVVQVNVSQRASEHLGVPIGYDLTGAPPQAYLQGLRAAFWTCFAFGAFAAALAFVGLHGIGVVGGHEAKSVEVEGQEEVKTPEGVSVEGQEAVKSPEGVNGQEEAKSGD